MQVSELYRGFTRFARVFVIRNFATDMFRSSLASSFLFRYALLEDSV